MNPALERVLRWFFPRRCALCGAVVALDEPLCPECQKVRPIARAQVPAVRSFQERLYLQG